MTTESLQPFAWSCYREFQCEVSKFTIDKSDLKWHNYALCGVKGVMEHIGCQTARGFNAMVAGRIPKSAGLSSSSALVCCAAITMATINDWQLTLVSSVPPPPSSTTPKFQLFLAQYMIHSSM